MEAIFISKIDNLIIRELFSFTHMGLTYTNDKKLVENLTTNKLFIEQIGTQAYKNLMNADFFIIRKEIIHDEEKLILPERFRKFSEASRSSLPIFWMFTDNSIFCPFSAVLHPLFTSTNYTLSLNSNASGLFDKITYRPEQLIEQLIQSKQILSFKLQEFKRPDIKNPHEDVLGKMMGSKISYLDFTKTSRMFRAFLFIDHARDATYPVLKISFYAGALECLFTTDGSEISHKVAERVAFYIHQEASKTKKEIYKTVKDIYDVRSKFMHGQALDSKKHKDNQVLIDFSISIDHILRLIMQKIVFKDSDIFLDNTNLEAFFKDLVLGED